MLRALRTFVLRCLGAAPQGANVGDDYVEDYEWRSAFTDVEPSAVCVPLTKDEVGFLKDVLDSHTDGWGEDDWRIYGEASVANKLHNALLHFAPSAAGTQTEPEAESVNEVDSRSLRSGLERDGE